MKIDNLVVQAAFLKFKGQLQYLSEDLASLALFSDSLSTEEKKNLIKAMKKPEKKHHLCNKDKKFCR